MSPVIRFVLVFLVIAALAIDLYSHKHPGFWQQAGGAISEATSKGGDGMAAAADGLASVFAGSLPRDRVAPTVACLSADDPPWAVDTTISIPQRASEFRLVQPVGCQAKRVKFPDGLMSVASEAEGRYRLYFPPTGRTHSPFTVSRRGMAFPDNPRETGMWYAWENLEKHPQEVHLVFSY